MAGFFFWKPIENITRSEAYFYQNEVAINWRKEEKKVEEPIKKPKPIIKVWTRSEIIKEIQRVFGKYSSRAICIAKCESNLRPRAIGDRWSLWKSYGIFQIRALPGRPSISKLLDPKFNISYAYRLFKANGWSPWKICSWRCK